MRSVAARRTVAARNGTSRRAARERSPSLSDAGGRRLVNSARDGAVLRRERRLRRRARRRAASAASARASAAAIALADGACLGRCGRPGSSGSAVAPSVMQRYRGRRLGPRADCVVEENSASVGDGGTSRSRPAEGHGRRPAARPRVVVADGPALPRRRFLRGPVCAALAPGATLGRRRARGRRRVRDPAVASSSARALAPPARRRETRARIFRGGGDDIVGSARGKRARARARAPP